ncbi:hypothetical protein AYO39_02675 [Actinobacteria bacterium SCGC AG-212-D09]|nr:hypothetical protein AYO39_02675 [Actinobacteria bacterium SCGC AG-212-D09]
MTTRTGRLALALLGGAAVALIALELGLGAGSFGQPKLADPCTASAGPSGGGLDGTVQRFARAALDGAACQLHTTREELVLSFVPGAGTAKVRWSRQTIDRALRAGLQRAAHQLAGSGIAGNVLGFGLSQLVAPSVESLLGQAK